MVKQSQETQTPTTKLTFEQLPEAVEFLLKEIAELKSLTTSNICFDTDKHRLVNANQASVILKKCIGTIYNLTSANKIPFFKFGNQLYFYEDELLAYIEKGRNRHEKNYNLHRRKH